ncbi:MAG: Uma2 family endonuclease [Fimbriiglobus sp.]
MPRPAVAPARVTVVEYLRAERAAAERHLFLDGTVTSMAGESLPHGQISFNLTVLVGVQLRGRPCQGFVKDTKVRSGPVGPLNPRGTAGLFSYPDVVIVCGPVEHHDEHKDVVLNPTAIFEVLSPSTERYDRGEKFRRLREWNPTLMDYVLVSQDEMFVEQFTRQADGSWRFEPFAGPAAVVRVASVGCELRLADVYDRVEFPPPNAVDGGETTAPTNP